MPEDLFRTLPIGASAVAAVIESPIVKAVTLTGSTPAGRAVAKTAGAVLKKTVLELGGSDAYVVLEDADLDGDGGDLRRQPADQLGAELHRGEAVHRRRGGARALRASCSSRRMRSAKMGDPSDRRTSRSGRRRGSDLRDELHEQVRKSIGAGARCLLGGEVPEGPGPSTPPPS